MACVFSFPDPTLTHACARIGPGNESDAQCEGLYTQFFLLSADFCPTTALSIPGRLGANRKHYKCIYRT